MRFVIKTLGGFLGNILNFLIMETSIKLDWFPS